MSRPLGFMVSDMIERQKCIKQNLYNLLVSSGIKLDHIDYYRMQELVDIGVENELLNEMDLKNLKQEW